MRASLRVFSALLILGLTVAVALVPAFADSEGHFDRTLAVTGPVDLTVQTGSGTVTVRRGDSANSLKNPARLAGAVLRAQ